MSDTADLSSRPNPSAAEREYAECDPRVAKQMVSSDRLHYDVIFLDFVLHKSALIRSLEWIRNVTTEDFKNKNGKVMTRLRSAIASFYGHFKQLLFARNARGDRPFLPLEEAKPIFLLRRLIVLVHWPNRKYPSNHLEVHGTTLTLINQRNDLSLAISKLKGLHVLREAYHVFKDETAQRNKEELRLPQEHVRTTNNNNVGNGNLSSNISTDAPETKALDQNKSKETKDKGETKHKDVREIITISDESDEEEEEEESSDDDDTMDIVECHDKTEDKTNKDKREHSLKDGKRKNVSLSKSSSVSVEKEKRKSSLFPPHHHAHPHPLDPVKFGPRSTPLSFQAAGGVVKSKKTPLSTPSSSTKNKKAPTRQTLGKVAQLHVTGDKSGEFDHEPASRDAVPPARIDDGESEEEEENDENTVNEAATRTSTLQHGSSRKSSVTQLESEAIRSSSGQEGEDGNTPMAQSKKKRKKKVSSSSRKESTTLSPLILEGDDSHDEDEEDEDKEEDELSSSQVQRISRMLRRGRKRQRHENSEESAAKRRSADELQKLRIEADKQVRLFEIFMKFAEQRIQDLPKKKKIELATQVYKALVSKDVHIANNASVLCEKIAGVHHL